MSLNHVIEAERAIDHRLYCTIFKTLEDVFHRSLATGFGAGGQPHAVPLDNGHLGDHLENRQWSRALGECAVDVYDAVERQRGNQLWKVRSADRVECDARPFVISDSLDLLYPVDLLGGNNVRRTGLE